MSTLDEMIVDMFEHDNFSNLNLFRNPEGEKFQCNCTHRATGAIGIGKSDDPGDAIFKALKKAKQNRDKLQKVIDGEHLKNLKPAKPSVDDLL